jgi:WXG100 family type VII secretion target
MSSARVRAQYDELDQIAQRFSAEAESANALNQTLRRQVATLQSGDWIGPGASAFYAEMSGAVFPALLRLGQALDNAARGARQIQRLFREAESDAADVLRRHAQAGAASAASGAFGRLDTPSASPAASVMNAFGLGPQTRSSMAGGGLVGGGGGLLFAAIFQNKPDLVGNARLGFKPLSGRWQRSFHLDAPHGAVRFPHFNAEIGPLKYLNHQRIPNWMLKLGKTSVLKGIGKATVVVGLALDAYTIFTAAPGERGGAIGGVAGGWGGALGGAAIGSAICPGVGTVIGGIIGGLAGGGVGEWIGHKFFD